MLLWFQDPVTKNKIQEPACKSYAESLCDTQKKSRGILSSINVTRLNELTPREMKLYKIYRGKLKEIIRLRNKMKKRQA